MALSEEITERKRAEQVLRRSEAYLAEGQRLAQTAVGRSTVKTDRCIYWSEENATNLWMKEVLEALLAVSECDHVFSHTGDPGDLWAHGCWKRKMGALRTRNKTHPDAGLHGLRHTFLTEAGEHTNPFTLQYVARHDNINTTMRYVHPQANAVQQLFCDWRMCGKQFPVRGERKRRVGAESGAVAIAPHGLSGK